MDRSETVTLFNDLSVLAPAVLTFNDDGELVDFVSDDRLRATADGRRFIEQRWSTPLGEYRTVGDRRVATYGEGRWHATEPEGVFSYLEFHVDEITYNIGSTQPTSTSHNPHAIATQS